MIDIGGCLNCREPVAEGVDVCTACVEAANKKALAKAINLNGLPAWPWPVGQFTD